MQYRNTDEDQRNKMVVVDVNGQKEWFMLKL